VRKPFSRDLGRLLRRRGHALRLGDLSLEQVTREVRRGGRRIDLTPTEFRLLELFLSNPGRVLTHAEIFSEVWGFDFGPGSNLLSVYVGYLRRKTEARGEPRLLHTVRGVGYVLRRSGS
jgi:two-component system response regulator MprA